MRPKKQLNSRGIEETMYEAYTAGDKDYSALVSKMKAEGHRSDLCGWLSH